MQKGANRALCPVRPTPEGVHEQAADNQPKGTKPGINLLSSLELIQGSTKVYETPLVQAKAVNVEGRDAVAIELDVPLSGLKPGSYLCQLNVIDDAGGSFAFPRFAVLVREPLAAAAAQPAASQSSGGVSATGTRQGTAGAAANP